MWRLAWGRMTLKTLQPYEVEYLAFSPDAALADDNHLMKSYFYEEKRWNGTDSEKADLICKLTVDNILFLSEKRLPNVSNKKNAKYEEFIDFCLMVCCVAVQAQLVTYPEDCRPVCLIMMTIRFVSVCRGATGKICLSIMCRWIWIGYKMLRWYSLIWAVL